jgi:hypothetical protein
VEIIRLPKFSTHLDPKGRIPGLDRQGAMKTEGFDDVVIARVYLALGERSTVLLAAQYEFSNCGSTLVSANQKNSTDLCSYHNVPQLRQPLK